MSTGQGSDVSENQRGLRGDTMSLSCTLSGASKSNYRFIALEASGKPTNPHAKSIIRQHVMQGRPKSRKPHQHDPNRIEIYIPPSFLDSQLESPPLRFSRPQGTEPKAIDCLGDYSPDDAEEWGMFDSVSPVSVLGQGRLDPFTQYPIDMRRGDYWLMDQVNIGQDLSFKNLRDRWLPLAINNPGSFHQFLSNAALNISRLRGEDIDGLVSAAHHSLAVRTVNNELSDPDLWRRDEVIASIVEFTCYSVCTDDIIGVSTHLNGLKKVINLRGGINSLENLMLARLVYAVDVSAASRLDTEPSFPLPTELLHKLKMESTQEVEFQQLALQLSVSPWKELFPEDHPLVDIFNGITAAITHIKFKASRNEEWRHADTIVYWFDPIMHQLLGFNRLLPQLGHANLPSLLQELCRLGVCLFLGPIRRNCGKLGVSTRIYVSKLKELLSESANECRLALLTLSPRLLLWSVFFGMLESWNLREEEWFVQSTLLIGRECGFDNWSKIVTAVSSFLWIENMFNLELQRAHNKFTAMTEPFLE